ncbi:MAG: chromosome segregation protein SMC [Myxococcales bacterium]|nr:chromosome segregation protein SMC [Myxococcales bacterium]
MAPPGPSGTRNSELGRKGRMRIKRLEIVGFKSFCDRTVLHFNDPITAVVGPNGCGKSNIVDAIRWCMGEQSAKHLRGKAMDDVIFGGSDSRGGSGMCEVSLTFDNDGRVPVEYLAYSEITVTRKLFRDGTSEYWINKTPCRLRDVTDFFLGTGIGAKAYSIIEQGRVGMIVSSKPEDRRFLIEEAAGITKYKQKKKAAEKKMDSTRQNLLRVSDVVAEIEKQLGSLRRQAQKAERYKQYKAEVRDIELWSAAQRWLGLHVETRVAEEARREATLAREEAQHALTVQETSIETARLAAASEERRLSGMQERLYELDNRIKLGEAEAEHQGREAAQLDERGQAARVEIEHLGRQLEEAATELERLRLDRAAAAEATAGQGGTLSGAEEGYRTARAQLGSVQRDLDLAKGEIGRAQTDIARAESQERAQGQRVSDLDMRIGRVREEDGRVTLRSEELRVEVASLDGTLGGLQQTKLDLHDQRATHEARLLDLKDEVARGEAEMETLRTELHRRKSRHASLEEIQARYEGFDRGTRAIMKQKDERWGIRGLVADVVQAPAEYEAAVEAALGGYLGSVVVESHEVGVDGIEFLKTRREGRSSFIPLKPRLLPSDHTGDGAMEVVLPEALAEGTRGRLLDLVRCDEDYGAVAEALLGDVVVVDDLVRAIDLWRAGERRTLVTVDGELVNPSGVVTGGSRDAAGAGVLQQKRELRELEEIVALLQVQHDASFSSLVSRKAERRELEVMLEGVRQDSHQSEMAILTHEKDLARFRDELLRLTTRSQSLGGEQEDMGLQRAEAAREAEEALLTLREARDRLAAAEDRRDEHGRAAVALFERVDETAAVVTDLKVRVAQAREKLGALEQAIARTDGQRRDGEARRERLERSVAEGGSRAEDLRQKVAEERGVLVARVEESRRHAGELSQARSAYEERRQSLLHAEGELKVARSLLEKVTERVRGLELTLHDFAASRTHLEEQIEERYRVRVIDQLSDFHLRPPVGEVEEQRLRELRDLIERMGEINLAAIDEYRVLEERYKFLCAQKEDLESALGQLEEAIAQINRTSRKRFQEVFDLVNGKFQEIFPRLFRGGRAHLTLTASEDVLEAGIEIFAQPPGKKNVTVELLSGGEKALTAVSLIFAIFLIKPSPFCLLDEVDAPLDEANVGRFNDLVRAMTDRSQFIVITHNKRTMEIADTLYGITMEEPGCSKLVSVNLSGGRKAA